MEKYTVFIFFILFEFSFGQNVLLNSYRSDLVSSNDTLKLIASAMLSEHFIESNPDSSIYYGEKYYEQSQKLNLLLESCAALGKVGYSWMNKGNYPRALQSFLTAIKISEDKKSLKNVLDSTFLVIDEFMDRKLSPEAQRSNLLSHIHQYIGILYSNANHTEKAWTHTHKALKLAATTKNTGLACIANITLSRLYLASNQLDSALLIANTALRQAQEINYQRYLGSILLNTGRIHQALNQLPDAKSYYLQSIDKSKENGYVRGAVAANLQMANTVISPNRDSSLGYILNAYKLALILDAPDLLIRCYSALANHYQITNQVDSLVKYQRLIINLNTEIFNDKQSQQFQNIEHDEINRIQTLENEKNKLKSRNRNYIFSIVLLSLLIIGGILASYYIRTRKDKSTLESAYHQLQSTQAQLIQSEKMASLGELTAGIAHEIQNPLNFVNNFSELNGELIIELEQEARSEKRDTKIEAELFSAIKENSKKINQHGKRAENIVKGMLEHSRKSSGLKTPNDLNKLCDEYVRLSYQGLRAKDKGFSCDYKLELDPDLPLADMVSQDIGRVILNIINNAFQACAERHRSACAEKSGSLKLESQEVYKPLVTLKTKLIIDDKNFASSRLPTGQAGLCAIFIADNGPGIPAHIKDKIFQPFFTTKPTGQGTGLGLSIAYDIIKAHGGTIEVNSELKKGTEFVITLPL